MRQNPSICDYCGCDIGDVDTALVDGARSVCEDCVTEHKSSCDRCGHEHWHGDLFDVQMSVFYGDERDHEEWCEKCLDLESVLCVQCGESWASAACHVNEKCPKCRGVGTNYGIPEYLWRKSGRGMATSFDSYLEPIPGN
jgi:phage FluMu protein Com